MAAGRLGIVRYRQVLLKLILVATLSVLCAGCGPTRNGATLEQLAHKIGGPKAGRARIVVIRDKDMGNLFDVGWQVRLDGAVMGDLKTGTFVYRDGRAGPHHLSFERAGDLSRASTQDFVAASGKTYVFRLALNGKGRLVEASAVNAGLAGLLISSALSQGADQRGLFDFTLLEGDAAGQAMADIRLSQ